MSNGKKILEGLEDALSQNVARYTNIYTADVRIEEGRMTDVERRAWAALRGDIPSWPAQIVATLAAERERCARIAETITCPITYGDYQNGWNHAATEIAAAIRKGQDIETETIEIRPNPSAGIDEYGRCEDVDEVCGHGQLHVEQMSKKSFWARLYGRDGKDVVMWFTSKSRIFLLAYRE